MDNQIPQQNQTPSSYESWLSQTAFRQPQEKSFIDKLLGRKEVYALEQLMKKEELTRSELLDMLYMLTSVELKLANLGEYDRYLLGKYFTWVRDFVALAEFLYDYQSEINNCKFSPEAKKDIEDTLKAIQKTIIHDVKFSVDIYLFLIRSTMGLTAMAFDTLSKGRYEYEYSGSSGYPIQQPQQPSKGSWLNPFKR
jgi:hypothetical protein